jgi:uncharacterized membrane protein YqgA involved in biofilm formation
MVAAFVCAFLRAYVVGGLEVATALLLEDNYGWGVRWVGVAIGLTFCTSFIASKIFDQFNLNALVRICSLCPIIGSLLMSSMSCDVLTVSNTKCPSLLLSGDVIVFSLLYNAESIIHGIAMSHVEPDGSLLNASNVTFMNTLLTDGLGRFFGPWIARMITDNGGQNIYAIQQVAGILIFGIAAEVVLATRVIGADAIEPLSVALPRPTIQRVDQEHDAAPRFHTPFSAKEDHKSITAHTCEPSLTTKESNPLKGRLPTCWITKTKCRRTATET